MAPLKKMRRHSLPGWMHSLKWTKPGRLVLRATVWAARSSYEPRRQCRIALAPKIKARMSFGFAASDDTPSPEVKVKLREAFEAAKVPVEVELYPQAQHG